MKRKIWIGLAIVLAGVFAFAGYFFLIKRTPVHPIEAISPESMLLFHASDPVGFWNEMVEQDFWKEWKTVPAVRHSESMLVGLDSIMGRQGKLQAFLKNKDMLISLHAVGREELDWLAVLKVEGKDLGNLWSTIEPSNLSGFSINSRLYSDVNVREFNGKVNDRTLSVAWVDGLLLMSFTSFLLEEAIRNIQSDAIPNLKDVYGDFVSFEKGKATIFLSRQGLNALAKSLGKVGSAGILGGWPTNVAAKIHPAFSGDRISFSGTIFSDADFPSDTLGPREIDTDQWLNFLPTKANTIGIFNFRDVGIFQRTFGHGIVLSEVLEGEIERKLLDKGFLLGFTGAALSVEMGNTTPERSDRILVFQTDSAGRQVELIREFIIGNSQGIDRSSFVDFYKGQEILLVDSEQFPAHLFNAGFQGFQNTFLTFLDGYLVMANGSRALRVYLDDIHFGNGQDIPKNRKTLYQMADHKGPISWHADIAGARSQWMEKLGPGWKSFFQKYAQSFSQFDKVSIHLIEQNGLLGIEGGISLQKNIPNRIDKAALQESLRVGFPEMLAYGPRAIRNFNDRSLEFLIQDQSDRVYLLTEEGEEVFNKMLEGPIVSSVFQIDFYENGKLQLLFATANSLYAIDRLGGLLPGFPIDIPDGSISYLSLVDYEGDRDYRYFIANESGGIYLLDREGTPLEGWNPKNIQRPLAGSPSHFRVPGLGDRMFALDRSGSLHLFNRRGESMAGSPVKLGEGLNTQFAIREGNSSKDTRLVTVTATGEVVMANFLGEITDRMQLPKPEKDSRFLMVKDPKNERYVWVVLGFNNLTVLDESYQSLFSKSISSEQLEFQYFSFGSDHAIVVILDGTQEFTYLYDIQGNLLTDSPLGGHQPLEILKPSGQNEFNIYSVQGRNWVKYRLPL